MESLIKNSVLKATLLVLMGIISRDTALAQCCSGGSGSPVAGGVSQGVLQERQFELNTNVQFISTDQFYTKDVRDDNKYFDKFVSIYEYFRFAYGVTSNFTMSIESGYFFKKKEIGLDENPAGTYESKGIGDLIIFPRYDVFKKTTEKTKTEVTVGLGLKFPLGSYRDSSGIVEPFLGKTYYITKPQSVQLSTGAQDFIFYSFFYREFTKTKFRVFSNLMYIKKGWNPIGEKLGDFASLGLFVGKSYKDKFGVTMQLRYEWVDKMSLNDVVRLHAYPNYDPDATGYKKVFLSPQLSYAKGKFVFYGLTDFPVYQYVNKTQVGSKHQSTIGISYKFFAPLKGAKDSAVYQCPMHPEEKGGRTSKCSKCGMDLEKQ